MGGELEPQFFTFKRTFRISPFFFGNFVIAKIFTEDAKREKYKYTQYIKLIVPYPPLLL